MAKLTIKVGIKFSPQPPQIELELGEESTKLSEKFPELLSFDVAPGGTVTWESSNIPFAIFFPVKNPFGDDNFMISDWDGLSHKIEKKVIITAPPGRPKMYPFFVAVEDPNGNHVPPIESVLIADSISLNT